MTGPGWWFCNEPGREEARARIDRATGERLGSIFTCQHGTWSSLAEARAAHSIEGSEAPLELEA